MDRALRFHTQCEFRSAINKPLLRIGWIFQCRSRDAPHSLIRGKLRRRLTQTPYKRRLLQAISSETTEHQSAPGACFHFDARFFFERLDNGGGVLSPEAERNRRFEIFSDNAQRRNG